jgi:lipoprotein-anchoring transpeptidase ErfK/SrfK
MAIDLRPLPAPERVIAVQRARRRRRRFRVLRLAGGVLVVTAAGSVVFLAATRALAGPGVHRLAATKAPIQAELAESVTVGPGDGTTAVPLDAPVTVTAASGHLVSVAVTTPAGGGVVEGSMDPSGLSWTGLGPLAPDATYEVEAVVADAFGQRATAMSSFTTVAPTAMVGSTLFPVDGMTVGVGQPVVIRFTDPVTDPLARSAVLGRIHMALSEPVPVGAYWFSDTELHLRPETYWPTGEQIEVTDDLAGWNAGGGQWGTGAVSVRYAIGDARISTANLATDQMTVTDNGQVVATYPISGGSTQYPTMNGTHVVLDRQQQVQMISSTVGIPVNSPAGYDETVYWDVHISDSGEYVHAAPWSVGSQGHTNVSHGCINVSPADAQSFFNFSRVGDVVIVTGGTRPPVTGDHGVMDWSTPWSAWTPFATSTL